jgi:hypothetical protein
LLALRSKELGSGRDKRPAVFLCPTIH